VQNFIVRHRKNQKFSAAPFRPPEHTVQPNLSPQNLDVSDLKNKQPEMFAAMGLDDGRKLEAFNEELSRFTLQLRNLLRNPWRVAEALQPLNEELGRRLRWCSNDYDGVNTLVIGDSDVLLPNYASITPLKEKKNKTLNAVLLDSELPHRINLDRVPVFDGFIEPEKANSIVAAGHLFGENENRLNMVLHGGYSHRLQWECVRRWIKDGHLQVPGAIKEVSGDKSGESYSDAHLIAAIAYVKLTSSGASLWVKTVDSSDDVTKNLDHKPGVDLKFRPHPAGTGMSCMAPNHLMTTIKCFGNTFGLGHLQKYLNDSAVKRLVRFDRIDRSRATFKMKSSPDIKDDAVFRRMAILLNTERPPTFAELPFTLPAAAEEGKILEGLDPERVDAARTFLQHQAVKHKG
jgi:hypothetical protein